MNIIKYRTVALVYPHLSLEAEVELDNGDIIYSNISVNGNCAKEEYLEDNHWTYKVPLTDVDWELVDKDYYDNLSTDETKELGQMLVDLWNSNPVFDDNLEWIDFNNKSLEDLDR